MVAVLAGTASAFAGDALDPRATPAQEFLGFWEGIDTLDGSVVQISLSDIEDDGVLEHVEREGFFSICFEQGANYSQGRGFITGTGVVQRRGVLNVTSRLTCVTDDNQPVPRPEVSVQYRLRSRGRFLVSPAFEDSPAIVLHRISTAE